MFDKKGLACFDDLITFLGHVWTPTHAYELEMH
jgi:hypothetical protein